MLFNTVMYVRVRLLYNGYDGKLQGGPPLFRRVGRSSRTRQVVRIHLARKETIQLVSVAENDTRKT